MQACPLAATREREKLAERVSHHFILGLGDEMEKRIGLLRDYIKIKRAGSDETTFGGDQNFFAAAQRVKAEVQNNITGEHVPEREYMTGLSGVKAKAEEETKAEEKAKAEDVKKQKMGCGIVALSDIFLYVAGKYNKGVLLQGMNYVNRKLSQSEYCAYYDKIYAFAGGVSLKGGASGIKLWRKFNRMAKLQGWSERARWGFSRKKILPRMEEMLLKDIPVVLCMPMALLKKDKDKGVWFYRKNDKGEFVPGTCVNGHYVVVTELLYEKEDIYLVISSWGKQYFVKWKEYDELLRTRLFGAFLGNLLYIK